MRAEDIDGNHYFLGLGKTKTENDFNVSLYKNQLLLAQIEIDDEIKPQAATLISELKKMGITPVLLSGDKQSRCEKVAKAIGIREVHGEKLPDEKLTVIDIYKKKGKRLWLEMALTMPLPYQKPM